MAGWPPPGPPRFLGGFPELRRRRRILSVPPGSDRVPRVWTSIVTSTGLLDPRLPPRPMVSRTGFSSTSTPSPDTADGSSRSTATGLKDPDLPPPRHRGRLPQGCRDWMNHPVYKARATSPPSRPAMGSRSSPITYLCSLAVIGSSGADSLDKMPTVHRPPPPTTPALPDSMTLPIRPRARLLQGRHVRSDPAPRPDDSPGLPAIHDRPFRPSSRSLSR